jgi:hypothetical protein
MVKEYRKKDVTPMHPYVAGEDLTGVSISDVDKTNGSPKEGDMIAHDANNPTDRWLVSKEFFENKYIEVDNVPAEGFKISLEGKISLSLLKNALLEFFLSIVTKAEKEGITEIDEEFDIISTVACTKK